MCKQTLVGMDSGRGSSVPAWFAGFQAFENRFLFPGDGEVISEQALHCGEGCGGHRGTSSHLVRKIISDTAGRNEKTAIPVKGRAVSCSWYHPTLSLPCGE
jgi:hypothetical protein